MNNRSPLLEGSCYVQSKTCVIVPYKYKGSIYMYMYTYVIVTYKYKGNIYVYV